MRFASHLVNIANEFRRKNLDSDDIKDDTTSSFISSESRFFLLNSFAIFTR